MTGLEVLHRELSLRDEWQLGGGQHACWTPSTPTMLDLPGFRDPGSYLGHPVDPVFAVTLLDQNGHKLPLRANKRNWNPARLELKYRLPHTLATERRTVLAHDAFVSHWTITHAEEVAQHLWVVLWTRKPYGSGHRLLTDIEANAQGISFQESLFDGNGQERDRWGCAVGASFDADSWSVNNAELEGGNVRPALQWEHTPFFDLMTPGGLPGHFPAHDAATGASYFALAYPFEVPPGERLVLTLAAAFAPDVEHARSNLERTVSTINPIQVSEDAWISWFDDVPSFTCSDPQLQRLYWYRWAQHRIWLTNADGIGSESESDHEHVGIGRILDLSWHHSTDEVLASMRSLFDQDDEQLSAVPLAHTCRRVLSLHPMADLKAMVRQRLRQLTEMGGRPTDELPTALPRDPWKNEENDLLLPRLDRSVFAYDVFRLLDWLGADAFTNDSDWQRLGATLAQRIHDEFWDPETGFFVEKIPDHNVRRSIKTSAGFLPLLAGLGGEDQKAHMSEHLYDPEQFWTLHPVPSVSRDDPDFSPEGYWKNHRLDRPFHGRVWPVLNSHLIDAFGRNIERSSAGERLLLAELIDRTLRLPFVAKEGDRPTVAEHYHPFTGRPAAFLGRERARGGWEVDHILRYVAGIRPDEGGNLVVDPLPFRLQWFEVGSAMVGDHELDLQWDHRTGLSVRIDDEPAGHAPVGQALSVVFPDHWQAVSA